MRLLPKTLFGRLSLATTIMVALFISIQVFYFFPEFMRVVDEQAQRVHWNAAEDCVSIIQPLLVEPVDEAALYEAMTLIEKINPLTSAYIVDSVGEIRYTSRLLTEEFGFPKLSPVDIKPIVTFVDPYRRSRLPILGVNPEQPGRFAPFSAAPVKIGSEDGFLYLVLRNDRTEVITERLADYYTISRGLIALGVLLGMMAILSWLLWAFVTKRFGHLMSTVNAFGAGNYSARTSFRGTDEIGLLGQTLDKMADAVVDSIAQIRKLDTQRRQLVAMISHDLTTPLTAMRGYLDWMSDSNSMMSEEQRRNSLDTALKNTDALIKLVQELREYSKVDIDDRQVEMMEFSLSELLQEEVLPRFQLQAEQQGIHLELADKDGPHMVRANVDLIERVLSNLVGNALNYGRRNGAVQITLERVGTTVAVEISDDGIGISADELPLIFEPFFRSASAEVQTRGGSGLRLAIVKRTLELHGRDISVKSEPKKGTTFRFELPCP